MKRILTLAILTGCGPTIIIPPEEYPVITIPFPDPNAEQNAEQDAGDEESDANDDVFVEEDAGAECKCPPDDICADFICEDDSICSKVAINEGSYCGATPNHICHKGECINTSAE